MVTFLIINTKNIKTEYEKNEENNILTTYRYIIIVSIYFELNSYPLAQNNLSESSPYILTHKVKFITLTFFIWPQGNSEYIVEVKSLKNCMR